MNIRAVHLRSRTGLVAALTGLVLGISGCAGPDAPDDTATPAETTTTEVAQPQIVREAISAGAEVIDVRTPEEFADGHLRGAVNIDVSGPDFSDRIAELDEDSTYVVYCASGNRARTAIEQMRDQGLDELVNGGGYDDLVALGLPTS